MWVYNYWKVSKILFGYYVYNKKWFYHERSTIYINFCTYFFKKPLFIYVFFLCFITEMFWLVFFYLVVRIILYEIFYNHIENFETPKVFIEYPIWYIYSESEQVLSFYFIKALSCMLCKVMTLLFNIIYIVTIPLMSRLFKTLVLILKILRKLVEHFHFYFVLFFVIFLIKGCQVFIWFFISFNTIFVITVYNSVFFLQRYVKFGLWLGYGILILKLLITVSY